MSIFRDLKIAVRHLLKSPGFTATAVLMLALGIGATTAIFSIVEGVLLRPLPFPHAEQLVKLTDVMAGATGDYGTTGPDVVNYTRDTHSFSSLGAYQQASFELSGNGDPATLNAARLTGGVFPALGVQPLLGRVFTQQEDDQHQQVALLSYATWQSRFHGDPHILGTKILLDRQPYVVTGVMPRNFEFPLVPGHLNRSELWIPMSFTPDSLTGVAQASWQYEMVGRLRDGVTPEQARNDAERVAKETMRNYPAFMASSVQIDAAIRPLRETTVQDARPLVRTLFFAVAVVLLIACANLAGLLLVRAIRRRREIAVRLALGARAGTLIRQAILESLVLSVTGGVLGLVFAAVALRLGLKLLPETLPRVSEIALDWQVMAFALFVSILTGVLCGLVPAFAALRTSVNETLKEGGRTGSAGGGHARLRSVLVVAEIAVALVLLTASGLLLRSFEKMREVKLGFQPDHLVMGYYGLPQKQYATQRQVDSFDNELLRRLRQLPGVSAVGLSTHLPASGGSTISFVVDGFTQPKNGPHMVAWASETAGDYIQTMGIKLLRGRLLTEADKADTQLVIVVNRKLAERYWPGQDPIGRRMKWGVPETPTPWVTVVGEVEDIKQGTPDQATRYQTYEPVDQLAVSFGNLATPGMLTADNAYVVLRTALPPEQMESALLATVRSIDPQLPLTQVQTMEHAISSSEAPRRFNTVLISAFAGAAVLLAVLGIYSVIAFSVASRVQEMAIRLALGSQRSGIVRLVVTDGAKLALIGCAIGLGGAVAASHLLSSFLFGVTALDPLVMTLAAFVVLLLALLASLLPARRAAAVEPMQALRGD